LRRQPANSPAAEGKRDDCSEPAVLLINLLRGNGMAPAEPIDRILVYVPVLDRYFDPALPLEEQSLVDLLVRERAERKHILGPSLAGSARDACPSSCLHVYTAEANAMLRVRVKTETIRGR
jgi:hypothetical protein